MREKIHTAGPWLIANNGKGNGSGDRKKSSTFRIWRTDPDQPQGDEFTNRGYACIAPHVHGEGNAKAVALVPDMVELVDRIARLNPKAGEIGAGMLSQLIATATEIQRRLE